VVTTAQVEVLENGKVVATANTDGAGRYRIAVEHSGHYLVRAAAASLSAASKNVQAGSSRETEVNLTLFPSPVSQSIVVTATGSPIPEAQTGASISVIETPALETHRDLQQALALEPGIQFSQSGQAGAQTAANVRGGPDTANKVLIDGIPANTIGGAMDFGLLSSAGFGNVELFRGPNSALFGSDALASVVNVSTRQGVTTIPEVTYAVDGGSLGTYRQDASVGGAWKRFDYFSNVSRFNTQNGMPNSADHNFNYTGNFGLQLAPTASLRGTIRRNVNGLNSANSIGFFGIPDDGMSRQTDTSFGLTLDLNPTKRWHTLFRYGALRSNYQYAWYGPTGIPYDACTLYDYGYSCPVYLGAPVTIRGANGYVVSPQLISQLPFAPDSPGQAVFQFPGNNNYNSRTNRDFGYVQSDYHVNAKLNLLFGFRYEDERGLVNSAYSQGATERGNYSYMMQVQGGLWNRLFYTLGSGIENNAVFGWAGTPRASLAYYLRRPSSRAFSGTKVRFNFGKGIMEPSIPQELNSLYRTLLGPTFPNGAQLIAQYDIKPFRAETSRTYDGGVEQQFLGGKARVAVTYFHNQFGDLAEYVPNTALAGIVPPEVAQQLNPYGYVYANTLAYSAQGTELEGTWQVRPSLRVRGGWTHVNAVVQHSLSSSALQPAMNPLFPGILIGAYSPLLGARPFHVAPNSGYVGVDFKRSRWFASLTGTFVSRRDDSTFLTDTYNNTTYDYSRDTMLLPNHNLDQAYQKLDLYGSYQLTHRLTVYTTMENVLNQHYQVIIGYPALPFTVRGGMKIRLGGESWKLN
jgi:iron complex outermembrane receptor protein/vitamin B12 transporter